MPCDFILSLLVEVLLPKPNYSSTHVHTILTNHSLQAKAVLAQAPCKHLVEMAKAQVASNPRATEAMRMFANIRLEDAEVGVHRLFRERGYSCPLKISEMDLGEGKLKKFPFIKLSDWMQYLIDTNRLSRQMAGAADVTKMKAILNEFWRRQKAIRPDSAFFEFAAANGLSLSRCIPFMSHTDEGRSYKHLPLFVLSSHGALGRGSRSWLSQGKHKAPLRRNAMGLNMVGATWSTNFIFCSAAKYVIQEPGALDKILEMYSDDVFKLMTEGLQDADGQRWWFIHLATKADLPALQKLTNSFRSFSNVPRAASSRTPCKGICFLCSAGQEADPVAGLPSIPYENVSRDAEWVQTTARQVPWNTLPPILTHLPLSTEEQIRFFRSDLWHNAHLGVLKQFTASGFVAIVESGLGSLPAGSIEAKFAWLTGLYRQHFRTPPFVSEISRDTMCFPAGTASPIGKWSKGSASAEMMSFLDAFCRNHVVGHTEDSLLLAIVARHVTGVLFWKF